MSQFLICYSTYDLSDVGIKIKDISQNKELYDRVIQQYFHDSRYIWVITEIHDMVDNIELNLDIICEIAKKDFLVWYRL
ncbi:MAG: hypothetical protein K2M46_00460 [Lachnospiraceae bacterium]|nr:hypothetical protein [Lachnospiraceae bacterium]